MECNASISRSSLTRPPICKSSNEIPAGNHCHNKTLLQIAFFSRARSNFFLFFFFYSLAFHIPIIIIRESSNNGSLETRDWISNFSFNFWSVTVVWKIIRFLRNLSCTTCYVLGMINASERRFSVLWWLREQESSSFWSILEKFLRESFFLHLTYSTWMTRAANLFIKKWKRVGLHKIKYF